MRCSWISPWACPTCPQNCTTRRDTMEQVHECQSPVFLQASLQDGRMVYHIDVPREAPTVRGFAGILRTGLNGATPAAVAAAPANLYQQLGLHRVISPLRLRGLTAPAAPHEAKCGGTGGGFLVAWVGN